MVGASNGHDRNGKIGGLSGRTHDAIQAIQAVQRAPARGQAAPADAADTNTAGEDRRLHPRVPWRLQAEPALVEVEEPGHAWRALPVTLVDLAVGGLGLLAEEPIAPGSRVRVTFPLPDDLEDGDTALVDLAPWKGQGEVVHTRAGRHSEPGQSHIPLEARRPHHHGVRFHNLEDHAETRLLRALYGRLPDGWAVERYAQRGPRGEGEVARYAVVRGGKRVAQGFSTYDRARTRAMSLHMDEQAVATRRRREAKSEHQS